MPYRREKWKFLLEWKLVEENKWVGKVGPSNFVIVAIKPLENGKYELKYTDAPLNEVKGYEIVDIANKYGVSLDNKELITLRVFDDYYHEYEWISICDNRDVLIQELVGGTSFDINLLKDLKEPKDRSLFPSIQTMFMTFGTTVMAIWLTYLPTRLRMK
ncbi:hypothetical protein CYOC110262_18625 [Cytobacillus oceanisediminis]|uniref:Uncharacterized protein n=1 Tax=Cytobacillus oceanisediminis TaxID=665099 RepID=A0A562K6J8_9BACI|nr:hypothetical protein [Cytobacillus oceanisediminis]TWH90854.1 hypothetical protein IQ19_00304 [Cytobacillus oceanisediminis]